MFVIGYYCSFFGLFINDITVMMNKLWHKYGRRFSRIESPDVNTKRHDRPTKNRETSK